MRCDPDSVGTPDRGPDDPLLSDPSAAAVRMGGTYVTTAVQTIGYCKATAPPRDTDRSAKLFLDAIESGVRIMVEFCRMINALVYDDFKISASAVVAGFLHVADEFRQR